jgi:hypothetical protein
MEKQCDLIEVQQQLNQKWQKGKALDSAVHACGEEVPAQPTSGLQPHKRGTHT